MAEIVYEGDVGGGGNLFAGMKFFFLQRLPARQKYMQDVTNNGGEIVKLEKQADIVIADHALKNPPAGSISWTFIDKSVKGKMLEDVENHRAGPTTRTVREVGSIQPARSGRTPFTAQDDRDLLLWVTKAERNGLSIKGNDIYKQFEEINPRHTFQSWRDRWIKYLADRPRPEMPEKEISAQAGVPVGRKYSNHLPPAGRRRLSTPDDESVSPSPIKQGPDTQTRSSVTRPRTARPTPPAPAPAARSAEDKLKDKRIVPETTPIVPLVRKSTGGMNFTEEEDDFMMENYQIMADADNERGINAWAKFAVENPNHSAQEWHNYFAQTIKPFMEKMTQKSKKTASTPEGTLSLANKASSSKQSKAWSAANDDYEVLAPDPMEAQTARKRFTDPSTKDEKMFIEDLTAMAEENDLAVNFHPIICGRKIPLFILWQVINLDEFGGYDEVQGRNLWPQVARRLNFNDFKHADAPRAIKSAYEEVLPDFEGVREEFMAQLQEEEMIASQLRQTVDRDSMEGELVDDHLAAVQEEEEEEDDYDDDLEAPTSVPRQPYSTPSGKRSLEAYRIANHDGSPVLGSYNKRPRVDKGKGKELEIPSTPEDIINPLPKPHLIYQSSPLKYMQTGTENDDGEKLFVGPAEKPRLPAQRQNRRNLEPETQDFNFLPDDDDAESDSLLLSLPNPRKAKNARSSPQEDSSTRSQTGSQKDQELIAFIEDHEALGYRLEIVIEALESTSMTTGNAAIVMEALTSGNGIPDNIQGVWTKSDDAALEDIESEEFERVANKHGAKSLAQRQKFFEEQKEARRELEREARKKMEMEAKRELGRE